MKRFSRALALVLLLSIVLTAFGIFTGSAAEATEPTYGKVIYDMDAIKGDTITVSEGANGPDMIRNEDGYWELTYKETDPELVQKHGGDYFTANPSSENTPYINGEKKNTDYLVIDFDISTETGLLDGIYFHNRWKNASGGNAQANYIQLNGTDLDDLYVGVHQGGSKDKPLANMTSPATKPGDWLNVTFVYDVHGTDTSAWKLYIYFDGIYCGSQTGLLSSSVYWSFMRVSTDNRVFNGPDASTLFANFTYKTFEYGYDGPISKSGALGTQAITLDTLPDLKYTQENTPLRSGEKKPIASIERVGETDPVLAYEYDEINVNLKDGDVVTLYRSLSTPLVKDSNATVTFKDANGTVITPGTYNPTDLIYIAPLTEVDYSAGTILRRNNSNFRGNATYARNASYTYTMLEGFKLEAGKAYRYWLLGDASYTTAGTKIGAGKYVIDLNGYTLSISRASGKKFATYDGTNGLIAMRGGKLELTGSGDYAQTNGSALVVFEDVEMSLKSRLLCDQRGGMMIINRSNITANCEINSLRAQGAGRGSMVINDSYIETSASTAINNTTISSSGKRYGSMDCRLYVTNSTIKATGENGRIMDTDVHANSNGSLGEDENGNPVFNHSSATYGENDNDVYVMLDNAILSCSNAAFRGSVGELRAGTYDLTEQFSFDYNIEATESVVNASYLYGALTTADLSLLASPEKYTFDSYVKLDDTNTLNLTNEAKSIVYKSSMMPSATVSVDVPEEFRWYSGKTIEYGSSAVPSKNDNNGTVLGAYWVTYEKDGVPPIIYTKNVISYPYIINGHEYEFIQHAELEPSYKDIPAELPADSSMLSYKWVFNVDGAFEAVASYIGPIKANVTASESLALNIYIPATFGDDAYNYIYTEKNRVENIFDVTVNGVAYKGFTIPGIDPTSAAIDTTVKFRVVDETGATADVSVEVSVLDYIKSALKDESINTEGKTLVAALLNYIAACARYNDPAKQLNPEIAALLELDEFKSIALEAPALGEAKNTLANAGAFSAIRVALDTNLSYQILVKEDYQGDIKFSAVINGELAEGTFAFEGGEMIVIASYAYEFEDLVITATTAEGTGEINLAGYLGMISEEEKTEELMDLIDAIRIYTAAAKAFR